MLRMRVARGRAGTWLLCPVAVGPGLKFDVYLLLQNRATVRVGINDLLEIQVAHLPAGVSLQIGKHCADLSFCSLYRRPIPRCGAAGR
jgi:hypothetical protein